MRLIHVRKNDRKALIVGLKKLDEDHLRLTPVYRLSKGSLLKSSSQ